MGKSSRDLESEIKKPKEEAQHWKLGCLVLKYQNVELQNQLEVGKGKYNELYLESEKKKSECSEVKKKFETLIVDYDRIKELTEPSMIVYKRKRNAGGNQRDKCDKEIESCNCGNTRVVELEKEFESCGNTRVVELEKEFESCNCGNTRVVELEKELEDYKTRCHGLLAEVKGKETACVGFESKLKSLLLMKDVLHEEIREYRTKCSGLEERITGLVEERKGSFLREKMALERIDYLEEVVKKIKSDKTEKSSLQNEVSSGYTVWKKCVDKKTCRTSGGSSVVTRSAKAHASTIPPSSYPSPVQGNLEDVHVAGTTEISDSEDKRRLP